MYKETHMHEGQNLREMKASLNTYKKETLKQGYVVKPYLQAEERVSTVMLYRVNSNAVGHLPHPIRD